MNALDAVLLGMIIAAFLYGLVKGIAHLFLTLAGSAVAFLAASQYYAWPAAFLEGWLEQKGLRNAVGFTVIFVVVLAAAMILVWMFREFLKTIHLRWLDRAVGGFFGLVTGYGLAILCVLLLTVALSPRPPILANSTYAGPFLRSVDFIAGFVPGDLKDQYDQNRKKLERYWQQ